MRYRTDQFDDEAQASPGLLIRAALARTLFCGPLVLIAAVCLLCDPLWEPDERLLAAEALRAAALCGDVGQIEAALAAGADINSRDSVGNTALIIAACAHHPDAVRRLIGHGAAVNVFSRGYGTPLCAAVRHGDLALVRHLLESGADPNASTDIDCIPLVLCAASDSPQAAQMASALLRAGADVNRAGNSGTTPRMAALKPCHRRVTRVLLGAESENCAR